jgi:phosphoribosyl 1,2-cyclic phosphodiesterase
MQVKFYGTRGSLPVSDAKKERFGGNTTSLRVYSDRLPSGLVLAVDGGSGFLPLSMDALKWSEKAMILLFTHYHYDHVQGLLLSPVLYMPNFDIEMYGPIEYDKGPREMLIDVMRPPYHPVDSALVLSHLTFHGIDHPSIYAMVIHPQGGVRLIRVNELEDAEKSPYKQIEIGGGVFPVAECLVVKMYRTNHPERAISFRFEERNTKRVFTFVTDHENQAALPFDFRRHVAGSHLLVMDSQYSERTYQTSRGGYGHGTPKFCTWVAGVAGAERLGLTHHDPAATDDEVDDIVAEAKEFAPNHDEPFKGEVFALGDYYQTEV